LFIVHRSSFIVLLVACASARPPAEEPVELTAMPSGVLDSMCSRLHDEGYGLDQVVDVVKTTRPFVTERTLQALIEASFYKGRVDEKALAAALATNEHSLPVTPSPGCKWIGVDAKAKRRGDAMLLELSAPFTPPFKGQGFGVLARFSLGGENATWYWIPLATRGGFAVAGQAMPLSLHD